MNRMPDLTPYPLEFARALAWIFQAEGYLSDDPDDAGGITKYGISLRWLRSHPEGDVNGDGIVDADDIRALTPVQAADFYFTGFWQASRADQMPGKIALAVFDFAVNAGVDRAAMVLQQSLRVKADGIIGPVTLAALRAADQDELLADYLGRRALFYHDIVTANTRHARFLRGWLNRLFRLQRVIVRGWL